MMKNLFVAAAALASSAVAAQGLLITNARIIDGTGQLIENGTVLIEDERIVSVTAGDARNDAAREIDAGGMTVMPELGADRMAHAPVQSETDAVDIEALARSLIQSSVAVATTAHFVAPITNDSGALVTLFGDRPFTDSDFRILEEHMTRIRALWDAGVTIAFGTDSFVPDPTRDIRSEIETLARVFSPDEVLTALTRNAAAYLQLDSEIGTLEVGKPVWSSLTRSACRHRRSQKRRGRNSSGKRGGRQ